VLVQVQLAQVLAQGQLVLVLAVEMAEVLVLAQGQLVLG
jgi:hypothetical protein